MTSHSSSAVVIAFAAQTVAPTGTFTIQGAGNGSYNGNWTVVSSTTTSVTYNPGSDPGAASGAPGFICKLAQQKVSNSVAGTDRAGIISCTWGAIVTGATGGPIAQLNYGAAYATAPPAFLSFDSNWQNITVGPGAYQGSETTGHFRISTQINTPSNRTSTVRYLVERNS